MPTTCDVYYRRRMAGIFSFVPDRFQQLPRQVPSRFSIATSDEAAARVRHSDPAPAGRLRESANEPAAAQSTASGHSPRVAIKVKGRILLIDLAKIVAVQAQGNYVVLVRETGSYLLRESISTMAEKLLPYGFIRVHRSVLVNSLCVEEVRPCATGEYAVRVRGGREYAATRTYKKNLRALADVWIGADTLLMG